MKKSKLILALLCLTAVITSCKRHDLSMKVPGCVEKKIEELKDKPVQNPPAEVWQWKVDGATYYYITSDCCDQFNYLYDEDCNVVCAPDGGFTGTGDGNCPEFSGTVEKKLVWKVDR